MPRPGDLLAAYGLLRPGADGLDRLGVRAAVRRAGACRIPGRLIDLGDFPGLAPGPGQAAGDLIQIVDARAWPILDGFEDYDPAHPERSAYLRRRIRLIRPALHAWVYLWNGPADAGLPVADGDWLKRPQRRPRTMAHGQSRRSRSGILPTTQSAPAWVRWP